MTTTPKMLQASISADWAEIDDLAEVTVTATERTLDRVTRPTVLIRQTSIGSNPESPKSHRNVGILLTIISQFEDMEKAGEQLDRLVLAVLDYLDPRYQHDDATRVAYADRLAYDIPTTVIVSKD